MVEDEVVEALVAAVVSNYPPLAPLLQAQGQMARPAKLQHWDRNAPLPEDDDRKIPWADAREDACSIGLRAFSPDLAEVGQRFFDNPWIDAPAASGQVSRRLRPSDRAVSAHPYLLLNYHGKARDVMTLGA
jgi:oligoendopeptidase F